MTNSASVAQQKLADPTPKADEITLPRSAPMLINRGSWSPLPGASSVTFMALRNRMCRWPVDDLENQSATRYCGAACESDASYCATHAKMAFSPSRSR